jgi:hypothetical protein
VCSEDVSWQIPEPIPIDWTMRDLSSAKISSRDMPDGFTIQKIEHAILPGVKPEMMLWFLGHMDQRLSWRGHVELAYRYWHPRDHIHFERHGPFEAGCRFHIVEAFGADLQYLMNQVFIVTQLGITGFRMESVGPAPPVHMIEIFEETPDGMKMTVEQVAAPAVRRPTPPPVPPLPLLVAPAALMGAKHNAPPNKRRSKLLSRWLLHNVEEVGNLPHFLPELYATHAKK